ncbi:EAL domain-containing protein [Citrobacter koseri]|nr:EAL domain-containing protein [Citrobacter koseri]TFU42422.1 EAL domain-containing protein [Citrobacter koseri]
MISPLVNFILRQVEKDILSLRLRLPRTFYINFRLSESMIAMPELIDSFVEFQKRLPSDVKLTLEFPEVVYRDTTLEFDSVLRRLRVEGIKIKMSSLFLERLNADRNLYLPVDAVRIEKSITGLISDSKEPVASVDDIIRSAVNKNYTIIADGIENDQQYHYLSLRGVVLQQGNYWSMPLSSFHLMQYIIQSDKVLLC